MFATSNIALNRAEWRKNNIVGLRHGWFRFNSSQKYQFQYIYNLSAYIKVCLYSYYELCSFECKFAFVSTQAQLLEFNWFHI